MLSTKYVIVYPYDSTNGREGNNWKKYNDLKSEAYGYGDAILETSTYGEGTKSWNDGYSWFPPIRSVFFKRGGPNLDYPYSGIFSYAHTEGIGAAQYTGFRAVLIGNAALK